MSHWPLWRGGGAYEAAGAQTGSSNGTTVTADPTGHAKPAAWTELIASTSFAYDFITVCLGANNLGGVRFLVDIAVGAAGSEETIVQNLPLHAGGISSSAAFPLPLRVRKGVRLSARCQASTGSSACDVMVIGEAGTPRGVGAFQRATTYGFEEGDSGGTLITSANSDNALPSTYTQLALLTQRARLAYVMPIPTTASPTGGGRRFLLNLYRGASGQESLLLPNLPLRFTGSTDGTVCDPCLGPFAVDLPAGARLSGRIQASTGPSSIDLILLALD